MLAFLIAPLSAFAATYLLRHSGPQETLGAIIGAGTLAGGVLMGTMGALFVRLWDPGQGLIELGQIYLHNEAFAQQAVDHLDRAIAMDPQNPRAYTLRGIGRSLMNEPELARADWEKASTLAPKDPEPHVHRGIDGLRRAALQDAIQSLEAALQKDPEHARAHCFLGVAHERQGDRQKAFEHYDRAVTLAPKDATVRCERSSAYLRHGEYHKALQDAERAARLEDHLGLAFAVRGQALKMLGRPHDAMESFQEAIDLGVEPSVHHDVLTAMETLVDVDDGHEERV
jgi:Tfp pilus assembly protein PilF